MKLTLTELRKIVRSVIEEGFDKSYGSVLHLQSPSQLALWHNELTGQISDGMWENSRPFDHWGFWLDVRTALGDPHLEVKGRGPTKSNYNFSALIPIIGDRMVKIGRMGKANPAIDPSSGLTAQEFSGAEYMPETLEEFNSRSKNKNFSAYEQKALSSVTPEMAEKYYSTKYDMKDLKADLKSIQTALKTHR